jgi:DNA-binding transcriptional regulator YhcF (GntR family)
MVITPVGFVPGVPIYTQVADRMRSRIRTGEWPLGYQLPGLQLLAEEYHCSWGTIRNAQQVLVEEGLLSPIRVGMPTTVISQPSGLSIPEVLARLLDIRRSLDEMIGGLQREGTERRRDQASRVFIRPQIRQAAESGARATIMAQVVNASDQPVHDLKINWHSGGAGWGHPGIEDRGTLMPHDVLTTQRDFPADANFEVSGAVITFRDAAGVSWLRKPDGELTEWPG